MTEFPLMIKGLDYEHLGLAISAGHLLLLYFKLIWLFSLCENPDKLPSLNPRFQQCTWLVSFCSLLQFWKLEMRHEQGRC